jgi:lactam utilization protein B
MSRWSRAGVLVRVIERLQREQILKLRFEVVSLDSTTVKVHPDGTGALKKTDRRRSGAPEAAAPPRFIWLPRMIGVP